MLIQPLRNICDYAQESKDRLPSKLDRLISGKLLFLTIVLMPGGVPIEGYKHDAGFARIDEDARID